MARADDPVLVTTAPKSPRAEQRERQRRYLITMAIRVVCFLLAILLVALGLHWEAGIAVAASLILPWIAVIAANAGPRHSVETPSLFEGEPQPELDRGPDER